MFRILRRYCADCCHAREAPALSFSGNSIDHLETGADLRYFGPRCFSERNLSRELDRNAWLNLLTGNPLETAEYPLLNGANERIAGILAQMAHADAGNDLSGRVEKPRDEASRESRPFDAAHPLWDLELDGGVECSARPIERKAANDLVKTIPSSE
jgi:hypothetical protein